MKATKKEINEYKKEAMEKYGFEITYLKPNVTKKDLEEMRKSDKKYFKKRVIKSFFKSTWELFPLTWLINLFARLFIAGTVLHYFKSIGSYTIFVEVIMILWICLSFRSLISDFTFRKEKEQ